MKWARAAGWALFSMISPVLAGDYSFITSPPVMELVNARRTPPANHRAAESQRIYGHRRFLSGCGLAQCAGIHDDEELRRAAAYFIEDGVRIQRGDGAFPEKGGHDSSYHAVALIYLQRILLLSPEESLPPAWTEAARRGADWLDALGHFLAGETSVVLAGSALKRA